jgi:hypothetical protein
MSLALRNAFERFERAVDRVSVAVTVLLGLALAAGTALIAI